MVFECTRSPFRFGGLLEAPQSSSLGEEQMEILIADAVGVFILFFTLPSMSCCHFGFEEGGSEAGKRWGAGSAATRATFPCMI